ncbi:MAG TPA: 2,3-diaminopropionate biosynthesis protein SbnB [Conexibacter sp.]|nr:2,3-diaminopropionate biosynthesis protein SbnB [Conexibacter sp.]
MTTTQTEPASDTPSRPRQPASGDILYLNRRDVRTAMGPSIRGYVEALRSGLALHAEGKTAQPLKPYLRWRRRGHIADRIIAMPGYVGGPNEMAGIKWIGSKHDNPTVRDIPRASAVIVLNDPETHFPVAIMEGGEISGMRTAGVTVLACEYLARPRFQTVTLVGCGFIGRLHALGLIESFPAIERLYLYDHNRRAARALGEELEQLGREGLSVTVCETAEEAVCRGEVVVPCTVTARPYIELDWLMPGVFVSNISIMDVKPDVYLGVDKLLVDDWEQANRERKTINQLVLAGRLKQTDLHAELGDVVRGHKPGREGPDERILLNPMGMAIEDVACAAAVYRTAREQGTGTWLTLA